MGNIFYPVWLDYKLHRHYLRYSAVRRCRERYRADIDWCIEKLTEIKCPQSNKKTSKDVALACVEMWDALQKEQQRNDPQRIQKTL